MSDNPMLRSAAELSDDELQAELTMAASAPDRQRIDRYEELLAEAQRRGLVPEATAGSTRRPERSCRPRQSRMGAPTSRVRRALAAALGETSWASEGGSLHLAAWSLLGSW